jgi:hypothetical protein
MCSPSSTDPERYQVSDVDYVYTDRAGAVARRCSSMYHESCRCRGRYHFKHHMRRQILNALQADTRSRIADDGDRRILYVPLELLGPGERIYVAYIRIRR